MSIVIHVLPTQTESGYPTDGQPAGYAGARQACFPLLSPGLPGRDRPGFSSDKHSLCNSVRSFLAVKRQEVTGRVE